MDACVLEPGHGVWNRRGGEIILDRKWNFSWCPAFHEESVKYKSAVTPLFFLAASGAVLGLGVGLGGSLGSGFFGYGSCFHSQSGARPVYIILFGLGVASSLGRRRGCPRRQRLDHAHSKRFVCPKILFPWFPGSFSRGWLLGDLAGNFSSLLKATGGLGGLPPINVRLSGRVTTRLALPLCFVPLVGVVVLARRVSGRARG
jgi:hypothetical protein